MNFSGTGRRPGGAAVPWDKGGRIAWLACARRTLLVLDGFEPLQHPPGPMEGRLKDQTLEALAGLGAEEWNLTVSALETADLVKIEPWAPKRVKGFGGGTARRSMAARQQNRAFPLADPEDITPPRLSTDHYLRRSPPAPPLL